MKRRDFLSKMAAAAAAAPFLDSIAYSKPTGSVAGLPTVTFGETGITTTRLAQGTGFKGTKRQSDHTRAGFESLVNLFRHGYDRGIRLFDLADQYGTHYYFREALRHMAREDVTILTKFQYRFDSKESTDLTYNEQRLLAKSAIERYRTELNVDVIDIMLMHNVVTPEWDKELAGYTEVFQEYRSKGIIKALGMSCHTLDALKRAADVDWVEIALTRINPYGKSMDGAPEVVIPVQKKFKARGAHVIGMKIFGAGKLLDQRDECMKFAQNLGYLDAMTIGARTPEEIDQNINLMAKYPAV